LRATCPAIPPLSQGRITKVLNMKPPEILGMIEETAGTRMFEAKKQAALKTIDKKQVKVDEINKVGALRRARVVVTCALGCATTTVANDWTP